MKRIGNKKEKGEKLYKKIKMNGREERYGCTRWRKKYKRWKKKENETKAKNENAKVDKEDVEEEEENQRKKKQSEKRKWREKSYYKGVSENKWLPYILLTLWEESVVFGKEEEKKKVSWNCHECQKDIDKRWIIPDKTADWGRVWKKNDGRCGCQG